MVALTRHGRRNRVALAMAAAIWILPVPASATQAGAGNEALRDEIASRYTVVRLSAGLGLVPGTPDAGVRMIELMNGTIALDGVVVTGIELRDRLGADADAVIRLSYLDQASRLALFGLSDAPGPPLPPAAPQPSAVVPEPPVPGSAGDESGVSPRTRRGGDRVRVFGGVRVERDESVRGDVVAVFGSASIDGEVSGDVVAVFGAVHLGADAVVRGDVTAVGGRVHRAGGATVRGGVHEIAIGSPRFNVDVGTGLFGARPPAGFGRLFGTTARLVLLLIVAAFIVLVARGPVERIAERAAAEPLKAGLVGFVAQLLFLPLLILTVVILAVSIIGIPLLLLVPFVIVAAVGFALAGVTGLGLGLGGWIRARLGWATMQPYVLVWLGLAAVLAPIMAARLVGLAGGFFNVFAGLLIGIAALVEYVAWTVGLGAAIIAAHAARRGGPAAGHGRTPASTLPGDAGGEGTPTGQPSGL